MTIIDIAPAMRERERKSERQREETRCYSSIFGGLRKIIRVVLRHIDACI